MLLRGNQKGVVLLSSYLIIVVLLILSSTFIARTFSERKIAARQHFGVQAFYLAEAALETALEEFNYGDWSDWNINGTTYSQTATLRPTVNSPAIGDFEVIVDNPFSDPCEVICRGYVPDMDNPIATKSLKATIKRTIDPIFRYALATSGPLSLGGFWMATLSYPVRNEGNIYGGGAGDDSDVGIRVGGVGIIIDGDAVTPETLSKRGFFIWITGDTEENARTLALPEIDIPSYIAEAKVGGIHSGDYVIEGWRNTENLGPLYIDGDLKVLGVDNTVNLSNTIYVTGQVIVGGIDNTLAGSANLIAEDDMTLGGLIYNGFDLVFCGSLEGDISLTGAFMTQGGVLYAPNGAVDLTGFFAFIRGSVVAQSSNTRGIGIGYIRETELESYPIDIPAEYTVSSWKFID